MEGIKVTRRCAMRFKFSMGFKDLDDERRWVWSLGIRNMGRLWRISSRSGEEFWR
jgi:hypothetical protein